MNKIFFPLVTLLLIGSHVSSPVYADNSNTSAAIGALCDSLIGKIADSVRISRVAVLPFTSKERKQGPDEGVAVAELAIEHLMKKASFKLVDRADFSHMITELELAASDLADTATALKAGQFLTADALLVGNISEAFGEVLVSIKLLQTTTGAILAAASTRIPSAGVSSIAKELLGERTSVSSSLFRSAVAPGWGQFYCQKPVRGAVALGLFAASAGVTIWSLVDQAEIKSDIDAHSTPRVWSLNEDENTRMIRARDKDFKYAYTRSLLLGSLTAVIWSVNLVDAARIATNQKKRLQKLYFSVSPLHGMTGAYVCITVQINKIKEL